LGLELWVCPRDTGRTSRLEGFWFDLKGNEKNIKSFLYRKI